VYLVVDLAQKVFDEFDAGIVDIYVIEFPWMIRVGLLAGTFLYRARVQLVNLIRSRGAGYEPYFGTKQFIRAIWGSL